ncbi:MAG: pantetheine-phosphate adenylyltransferase, partial [Planctomycetota bacterium]
VGVAHNPAKASVFQSEERVELLREATKHLAQVEIVLVPGLVVHACEELGCDVIVRGVRSGTDFDYELQMGRTNEELSGIDTVLLIPAPGRAHISSTLVRQIAGLNGDVSNFVPENILTALRHRYPKTQPHS